LATKKRNWEKYAFILSVIALVTSLVLSTYLALRSAEIAEQANNLTKQANDIALKSLNLQNYPSRVVPNTARVYLDKGLPPDNFNQQSEAGGWFNFSITVLTPYGGSLSVNVLNFTTQDYDNFLLPNQMNKTWCSTEGFEYSNHNQIVDSGLSQKDYNIPLKLYFYPDFNKLKGTGTSSEFLAIGILYLQATFVDVSGNTITKGFSEVIIANTIIPSSAVSPAA
jgi:hypothetical protein